MRTALSSTQLIDPLNISKVHEECGPTHQKYRLFYAPEIPTTMAISSYVKSQGKAPGPGDVLVAGVQTEGRGFSGAWLSAAQDIKMTMLMPERYGGMSEYYLYKTLPGLATIRTLNDLGCSDLKFKWPNDVYHRSAEGWRKICGMIVGNEYDHFTFPWLKKNEFSFPRDQIIIGVGISHKQPETDPVVKHYNRDVPLSQLAISVEGITGEVVPREKVLGLWLKHFDALNSTFDVESRRDGLLASIQAQLAISPDGKCEMKLHKQEQLRKGVLRQVLQAGIHFVSGSDANVIPYNQIERIVPDDNSLAWK